MAYQFALVRFVPDPARGEFVNIGAIAGDEESGDWAFRTISNYQRARALDLQGSLNSAISFAAILDERVGAATDHLDVGAGPSPMSIEELRNLSAEMQNIVQVSNPAPVVAESAEGALDLVFERLVVDPTRPRHRYLKKHPAQAATRQAYRAAHVPPGAVREKARVSSGVFDETFDFAVHNGRALQLVQCWSFQLPNQIDLAEQIKSWAWVVHELRDNGGTLNADDATVDVPSGLQIAAVCVLPMDGQDSPAFIEAESAFMEVGVERLTPADAGALGHSAATLLAAAH